MIDREHDLSITKQAAALNISRGMPARPATTAEADAQKRVTYVG